MGWIRVDDAFYDHHKFARVGALGTAAWIAGLAHCNRNLTDGFISEKAAQRLIDCRGLGTYTSNMSGRDAEPQDGIDELVDAGLWDEVDGGYRIHDYLDYQPSALKVREDRNRAKQRMQFRRGSDDVPANIDGSSDSPNPTPNPKTSAAAAAEVRPLPPEIEDLRRRLNAVKLTARWDKLKAKDAREISALIERHGPARLVKAAQDAHVSDNPAQFASAWLGPWRAIPEHVVSVREKCTTHAHELPCPGCAADRKAAS